MTRPPGKRRRASSIKSVEDFHAAAREVCHEHGNLSIMTEYIFIKPVTLEFNRPMMENSFMQAHRNKYRGRFQPLMIVIAISVGLMSILDILDKCTYRFLVKVTCCAMSLIFSFLYKWIYDNELILTLSSSALVYMLLISRVLHENESSIYLEAKESDIGFIYLLLVILGTVIGLRFIISLIISIIIITLSIVSVWISEDKISQKIRFETTGYLLAGFYFFNMVLLRKMEIQERRDYRLTKRLAAENVNVQMQMENFSLFTKGILPKSGDSSAVAPGGILSAGNRIQVSEIEILSTIGCGSHGDVLKGKYKATDVAIKKIRGEIKDTVIKEIAAESSIMADLRHPNIVMFMGLCLHPPMIVMEFCSHGSVFSTIHVDKLAVDWSLVLRFLMDAAHGMAFLHQHDPPIIHRDLKSLNLLLDENWRCKVSDFGLSKLKEMRTGNNNQVPVGSIPWMAPEIGSEDGPFSEKSDVYSFSIIIFELLSKNMPYPQIPMQGIPYLVSQGKRPDYEELVDIPENLQRLITLMKECWHKRPELRPDFETIIEVFEQEICPRYFGEKSIHDAIVFPRDQGNDIESSITDNLSFNICEDELTIGPKIGGGSYGAVYAGKWLGTDVAIKQLFIKSLAEKVLKEFNKECDLMRKLRHPNIVLFVGSSAKPPNLFLVTELMQKGSLFDIYHAERKSSNLLRHYGLVVRVATDMARGMAYLHSLTPPLIHRDLKSPNIMVDGHWVSKIGDFGLSRLKDENKTMTKCGSPLWVAPEVLQGHRFGEGCDIYSFAIIVWEVIAWSEPYPDMSSKQVMKEVALRRLRPTIPPECPVTLKQLIESCWDHDPAVRPSFKDILEKLEYIESIQCAT